MQIYNYTAKNENGDVFSDALQAESKDDAAAAIRSRRLQPLTIKKVKGPSKSLFGGGISSSEKAAFCRFMATMLRSGMSIPEATDIIREETKNKKLKKILSDVYFQTQKGKNMSVVLTQYEGDFDKVFLTLIRVGEESGTLEKTFDYLSKQLAASHDLRQTVTGSLMYPAVIIGAMMGNGFLMMFFVLPRIAGAFLKLSVPLPSYTRVMLLVGQFMGKHTMEAIIVSGVIMLAGVGILLLKRSRKIILSIIVKMPGPRGIIKQIDIARFSRTLSTLLKSGVPITEALDVSAGTLTQAAVMKQAKAFSTSVEKGESLSSVLMQHREIFPSTMIQSIRAGEQSGTLEKVLEEMADFYEKEVEYTLKKLTSLLEPLLMLMIGVAVGAMVIMMIAPIYSIIGGLQEMIDQ
jgi:type IV pilus assembly protein PilC